MKTANRIFAQGSEAVSYLLGGVVIVLAITTVTLSTGVEAIGNWALNVLGGAFVLMLAALILTTVFSWVRMRHDSKIGGNPAKRDFWMEIGMQAANGVTTLALTYTLLGISLGIGSLATQELTPETIQPIIRGLTANFSLAFMTTVIGLPASAMLRALLQITYAEARINNRQPAAALQIGG